MDTYFRGTTDKGKAVSRQYTPISIENGSFDLPIKVQQSILHFKINIEVTAVSNGKTVVVCSQSHAWKFL
jgi:hypothetical protein